MTPDAGPAPAADGPGLVETLRDLFSHVAKGTARDLVQLPGEMLSAGKGALKGAGSTALGLGQLVRRGGAALGINEDTGTHNVASDMGLDPQGLAEQTGFGVEQLAEFFGPAAAKAPKLLAAGGKLATLASMGIEGANAAGVTAAQGGDPELAGILGAAAPFAGKVAESVSPKVSAWLSDLARKGYGKAIGATTPALKAEAAKVVPELLDRGVTAMTRKGLANKVERKVAESSGQLKAVTGKVPIGTPVDTQKILQELESKKLEHMVTGPGGVMVPANAEAAATIAKIDALQARIGEINPDFHNVLKHRRILDDQITKGGKQAFGRSIDDSSTLGVTKEGANLERAGLAAKSAPFAAANKEFSLWKSTQDLLEKAPAEEAGATLRDALKPVMRRALVVGTAGLGGGKAAQATTALIAAHDAVRALVQSTGWRTVSAVSKQRLADLIARQDVEGITRLVAKLSAGVSSQVSREKQKREYFYKLRQSEKKPPEANR
jgi:hypothetical protein